VPSPEAARKRQAAAAAEECARYAIGLGYLLEPTSRREMRNRLLDGLTVDELRQGIERGGWGKLRDRWGKDPPADPVPRTATATRN
jgi:hypothetical protein